MTKIYSQFGSIAPMQSKILYMTHPSSYAHDAHPFIPTSHATSTTVVGTDRQWPDSAMDSAYPFRSKKVPLTRKTKAATMSNSASTDMAGGELKGGCRGVCNGGGAGDRAGGDHGGGGG